VYWSTIEKAQLSLNNKKNKKTKQYKNAITKYTNNKVLGVI